MSHDDELPKSIGSKSDIYGKKSKAIRNKRYPVTSVLGETNKGPKAYSRHTNRKK